MRIFLAIIIFMGALVGLAVYRGSRESSTSLANLCVQHSGGLRAHYHSKLTIIIDGQTQTIPTNIGITANCMRPVHTHDASGTIHIETPDNRAVYLRDFFGIWGKAFGRDYIFDKRADAAHRIRMTVNGKNSEEYENLVLRDGDEIIINY